MVEIVSPVADRVDLRHGASGTQHLAPGIVAVFCHTGAASIYDPDDVALEVLTVEVLRLGAAGNVGEADDLTPGVMMEVQRVAVRDLRHKGAAPVDIAVRVAADSLLRAQTGLVVDEAQTGGAVACRCQLPSALPGEEPAPVRQGIADVVMGDRAAVVRRQQIGPIRVPVGVGHRGEGRAADYAVFKAVLRLAEDVAAQIVAVVPGFLLKLTLFPNQLVQRIILVVDGDSDGRGDSTAAVIGLRSAVQTCVRSRCGRDRPRVVGVHGFYGEIWKAWRRRGSRCGRRSRRGRGLRVRHGDCPGEAHGGDVAPAVIGVGDALVRKPVAISDLCYLRRGPRRVQIQEAVVRGEHSIVAAAHRALAQPSQPVIREALQHAAVAALRGLFVSVVAVGVGEALPVDRLHQLRHLVVAVIGPAELVLVVGGIRLPDPDQAIRSVVVVTLRVQQCPARDLAVCHGGAVLLYPGQRALAVVEVPELRTGPVLHGPAGRQIVKLAVFVGPAVSVVFVGVIVRAAVHLPRQRPGPRVVAVLHQGIGAAHLNSRQQLRRAVCQRVVRGSIRRVGMAQARQQLVAVRVGDGAAARLAAHRTAPTVVGIARHGVCRIGDAHHQGELRVVGVAHRLAVVARDTGAHVPVRGVGHGAGQTLFAAAGDRRPRGVAVAIVAVAAGYPRVADGVVQQAAARVAVAVLRPAGQGDGGDVRGVPPVGIGGFPPLQVRDLVHTAFIVIVVDVGKLLPEQLRPVEVALICIIIVKEGKFNCIISAAGPQTAGKELPLRTERVCLQQLAVHLRAAVQQPHPDPAVPFPTRCRTSPRRRRNSRPPGRR